MTTIHIPQQSPRILDAQASLPGMKTRLPGILMLAPALSLLVAFFVVPVLMLLPGAFYEYDSRMRPTYVGLANFQALLASPMLAKGIQATVGIAGIAFVAYFSSSVGAGVILSGMKWRERTRTLFAVSARLGGAALSIFWSWLFLPFWGGLAKLSYTLGKTPIAWHSNVTLARLSSSLVVWAWTMPAGIWMMSVFFSAVPQEIVDAARVDGASNWQVFRHIRLPHLRRPLAYMAVMSIAGLAQVYEAPYLLWQGGPAGGTTTALMLLVNRFGGQHGQAAAFGLCFALVLGIICGVAWRLGEGHD